MARILLLSVLAILLSTSVGCRLCSPPPPPPPPPCVPARVIVAPPPYGVVPPPPQPIQQSGAIQTLPPGYSSPPPVNQGPPPGYSSPPPVNQGPPPGYSSPPPVNQGPPPGYNPPPPVNQGPPPPPQPPPSISKSPQEQTQWQPADGPNAPPRIERERSDPPRIERERNDPPSIRLYAPEPIDKGPAVKQQEPLTTLPPIAQFAVAKEDRIFTGLRPKLDGLDWLQSSGVKVVINIRLPDKDDSADRTQVEKRNMRYLAFEVSPQTLTKEKADEFIKLIRQNSEQAIFVYDEDGALAGSMWYLFMRLGIPYDDDTARIRAGQLGLEANRDGPHRDMWLAVQKLLSENSR